MKPIIFRRISSILSVLLIIVAMVIIHDRLKLVRYADVVANLRQIPSKALWAAGGLTILNYLVLTLYDALALRYIRRRLSYPKLALASFIGYVFSNNATVVGGSAARYRIYSAFGVPANEVAKLVLFCSLTFWLGLFAVAGVSFIVGPQQLPSALHVPLDSVWPLGILFLAIVAAYLAVAAVRRRPLSILGWEFPVPSLGISAAQIAVSSVDWILAASVLYAVLPASAQLTAPRFLAAFMLAQAAGLLSYVPGGLGVFETVILILLSGTAEPSALVGAMLTYRLIYYIGPLVVASILLAAHETWPRFEWMRRWTTAFGQWSNAVTPHVLAFGALVAGAILLVSGTLPTTRGRLEVLRDILPLPAIELSHFLGSLTGAGLLVLARGLQRRLDVAYSLTVALLVAGIVFSLSKGLDYQEAILLTIMLAALLPCRRHFHRKASLLSQPLSASWVALVGIIWVCVIWLGLFSYKHVEYSNRLWWQFALDADAPRFLRATVGASVVMGLYGLARLLLPSTPRPAPLDRATWQQIPAVVSRSRRTYAHLALLGDKQFILSPQGDAFIMYAVEGRSWVAMGDPVGPQEAWEDLLWRFMESCDQYEGWPVFYQIESGRLDLYADLGLTFLKLGEEARVPLQSFSLEGTSRKALRQARNRVARLGFQVSIWTAEQTAEHMSSLQEVSDLWLAGKNTREKRFSLGFFNADYLRRGTVAVVHSEAGLAAFANLWLGAEKQELSVDLMRYRPDCPDGIMDYLFAELLLWGRHEGYQWFNFGMSPLSGLPDRALAPLWSKAGAIIYRHGEHFYNFQGLRRYKEKFDPQWHPKYMACRGNLALPRVLANVAALISGGVAGSVTK
jgi:phosphatidylglycerol lysyltransferase